MKEKLDQLYSFLKQNRKYNRQVQLGFYNECLLPNSSTKEKVRSLLYHIQQTQSKPNLDKSASFWKSVHEQENKLTSFTSFVNFMGSESREENNYNSLFVSIKKQKGWGPKTSALFVKAIYHLHQGKYKKLGFWNDTPEVTQDDQLFLPVDAVIAYIFSRLSKGKIKTFSQINAVLKNCDYTGTKIEVWDDLWFWGFITQRGSAQRKLGFNESKYWALRHISKNKNQIEEVTMLSKQFISIIKG